MSRPSDRTLRHLGYAICVVAIVAAPVSLALVAWAGALDRSIDNDSLVGAFTSLSYGGVGLLLVRSETRNRLVWFFIVVGGLFWAGWTLATGVAELVAADQGVALEDIDVSGWPPGAALILAQVHTLWAFAFWGLPTLSLLLLPDGRLPSRRWLPVAVVTWVAMVIEWVVFGAIWPLTSDEAIEARGGWMEVAHRPASLALLVVTVLSLVSVVVRYRRGDHVTRRRLRWVLLGAALFALSQLVVGVAEEMGAVDISDSLFIPILVVSLGIAIRRDELFDVDLVISRTLLYGALAVFIGAVYVGVVFGLGALVGRQGGDSQALSLLATVGVAFLFQPVRRRLERGANRLVYGRRATPYEVLSDLSGRLARRESTAGLLDRMAALMAEGTGAERATVWRWTGTGYEPLASWPADAVADLDDGEPPVPIERAGERLGALTVTKRLGDELNPTERRLLDDLAGSAGLVLDRVRLDAALSDQAEALARSRRRLIGAQDEERQRLERQLQTGTQQQLTALAGGLDASVAQAAADDLGPVADQLAALRDETTTAQDEIRTLAQGIYPPVLEADGLAAAVDSLAATLPLPVEVRATGRARAELDVELAVYFCIAECLTNVVKHAEATTVSVRLEQGPEALAFEVSDDGIGLGTETGNGSSTGLVGLRDRIEAVGGSLTVTSRPGRGTTVAGSVAVTRLATVG